MVARTFQEREKTAGQSLRRQVNSAAFMQCAVRSRKMSWTNSKLKCKHNFYVFEMARRGGKKNNLTPTLDKSCKRNGCRSLQFGGGGVYLEGFSWLATFSHMFKCQRCVFSRNIEVMKQRLKDLWKEGAHICLLPGSTGELAKVSVALERHTHAHARQWVTAAKSGASRPIGTNLGFSALPKDN